MISYILASLIAFAMYGAMATLLFLALIPVWALFAGGQNEKS